MEMRIDVSSSKGAWFAIVESLNVFASGTTRAKAVAAAKAGALMRLAHDLEKGRRRGGDVQALRFSVARAA